MHFWYVQFFWSVLIYKNKMECKIKKKKMDEWKLITDKLIRQSFFFSSASLVSSIKCTWGGEINGQYISVSACRLLNNVMHNIGKQRGRKCVWVLWMRNGNFYILIFKDQKRIYFVIRHFYIKTNYFYKKN